jgi:23S rRNA (cytosine1962-C5)-methyltransferase
MQISIIIVAMEILSTTGWDEYHLLDSGEGFRLEQFGPYILQRPDPQAIWKRKLGKTEWDKADAVFKRTSDDKGIWEIKKSLPHQWLMKYKNLSFWVKLSPFKHTGVFPEQHLQWDFITEQIRKRTVILSESEESHFKNNIQIERDPSTAPQDDNKPNILNLFAYTGIASLAAGAAGAKVTHVDASKPTIGWARDNQKASGLEDKPIRWILDDAIKFTEREIKRGNRYDGIILDPPVFGHGPDGSVWKFNESFPKLMETCKQVLTNNPLFVVVNAYAISSSSLMLQNVLEDCMEPFGGKVSAGELVLEEQTHHRPLSTGIFARWSRPVIPSKA